MKKKNVERKKGLKQPGAKKEVMKIAAFHFNPEKIDLMRQAMVTVLWRHDELSTAKFLAETQREIRDHFATDFENYFEKVKTDLEKKKLIEPCPDKKVPHLRLSQKLEE